MMVMHKYILLFVVLVVALLSGCRWDPLKLDRSRGYQTVAADPRRDTDLARRKNAQGVALLREGNYAGAEGALKEALAADLFFGPAHNNLGTAYFHQKKYYLAAWEFQYAVKTMPHSAEPRNNLGMVLEAVFKFTDAEKWYDEALTLQPENPEVVANLARLYVRSGRKDEKTRQLLAQVVMKDHRPEWVAWARDKLAVSGRAGPPPQAQPDMLPGGPMD